VGSGPFLLPLTVKYSRDHKSGLYLPNEAPRGSRGISRLRQYDFPGDHIVSRTASGGGGGGGSSPTLLFASDWTNSTLGSLADADIRDTTKAIPWTSGTSRSGNFSQIYAASATGLGFPAGMSKVLKVDHYGTTFATVEVVRQWPQPIVGGFSAHRMYWRCDIPNSYGNLEMNSYHPIEPMAFHPPLQFEYQIGVNADGTLTFRISLGFSNNTTVGQAPDNYVKYDVTLVKFKTYRIEWKQIRISAVDTSTDIDYNYNYDVRIYDESVSVTTPAFTGADFMRISGPNPPTPSSLAAEAPVNFTMSETNPDGTTTSRSQTVGTNGAAGTNWNSVGTTTRDAFTYFGGVAVSQQDWCGPYVPGEHT
jgi:hypothetical protein